jgi:hypothetical protein
LTGRCKSKRRQAPQGRPRRFGLWSAQPWRSRRPRRFCLPPRCIFVGSKPRQSAFVPDMFVGICKASSAASQKRRGRPTSRACRRTPKGKPLPRRSPGFARTTRKRDSLWSAATRPDEVGTTSPLSLGCGTTLRTRQNASGTDGLGGSCMPVKAQGPASKSGEGAPVGLVAALQRLSHFSELFQFPTVCNQR